MNNFQLTSLITKIKWSSKELARIEEGLGLLSDYKAFYDYCFKWKLAPWVYTQLKNKNLLQLLPDSTQELFHKEHTRIVEQNSKRNHIAQQVFVKFKEKGIDVAVLKGNYFLHTVYKDVGYKRMNDFDILIRKEDWNKIQDVYLELGFIPLGFGWSGEKEKPAQFSHVGMSFISPDYNCIFGSQWGLKSPTTKYEVNIEEVWKSAVPFEFEGVNILALSPEYNFLHLILHLGIYKCGVRDCMDIYNLLYHESLDYEKMYRILEQANALDKAYFACQMSNSCAPAVPKEFIEKIKPQSGYLLQRTLKRLKILELGGDIHASYNDYFQDIEKDVIYFNLFPKFHLKALFYAKILRKIFFPNIDVALKLDDQQKGASVLSNVVSFLKAPYYIFSLIAQEIGWKFTFLLFLKLLIDLVVSLKNYIIPQTSYFDYLKSRDIDPKEIAKAVKNIQ